VTFTYWLQFIAAFAIVVGALSVLFGVIEWWKWRKENR
jgi:hypothetical protein